jgi:hypothetical protein
MPTPTIPDGELFFNATLYTGNGGTQTITNGVAGQSFQPDFVWVKVRSTTGNNNLFDSVRGVSNYLFSNSTSAESFYSGFGVTGFASNGFTLTDDSGGGYGVNGNGITYVGWNWKAGGAAVTNTAGTISSQVSANTTSGFSVVTYTGNSTGATVGHGLGVTPAMMIIKNRASSSNWRVWHQSLSSQTQSYLSLNLNNAATTDATIWNNTAPTSTVFSVGNDSSVNTSPNTYVAYCFAQIAGYSAFGRYTGNASTDGPFVYLGFRPRYILIKDISTSDYGWLVNDTARNPFNLAQNVLVPNSTGAESAIDYFWIDFLSNGFKLRTANATGNGSGINYIYMAFCENPLKYANAR